jgi:hypothetical protein
MQRVCQVIILVLDRKGRVGLKKVFSHAALAADLTSMRESFRHHGPFSLSWKSTEATAELEAAAARLTALRTREATLAKAAADLGDDSLFQRPPGLAQAEADVEAVSKVWQVQGRWEILQVFS